MSFVEKYAEMHGVNKKVAKEEIDKALDAIVAQLMEEGRVQISHFGTFKIVERAEREGHNPATGAKMTIPAKKVIKFAAAPEIKKKL